VLISNIASSSSDFRGQRGAHLFTTGSDAASISAVKIKFQSDGTASTVRIRRDAAGQPDMTANGLVATLTSPGTAEAGNVVSFAAPAGTVLEAGTTYWVTIHEGATGQPALWATAASPAVDALAGWSMDDGVLRFSTDSNTWSRYNKDLLFELRGTALPSVTLAVLDSSGNVVTSISEADTTAKTVKIKATVDEAAAADIAITLSLRGTATGSGTDYTAAFPTTVTIPSGSTSFETGTFSIAAVDDSVSEGDETVVVGGSATGYAVSSATVGLIDDDLIDYDTDDDGLIEVATAAQLNAIRWDTDGDGTVEDVIANNSRVEDTAHTMDYAAAYPAPAAGMGCPMAGCTGYELTGDIDLGVAPYSTGKGWLPIPSFAGTLDGNGNKITGLFMRDSTAFGLVAALGAPGRIEDLGIEGGDASADFGGGLVAATAGAGTTITRVWATGVVDVRVPSFGIFDLGDGGLVGRLEGSLTRSWSGVGISGSRSGPVGGLVGEVQGTGSVSDSLATGSITLDGSGDVKVGGLAGTSAGSITHSYSAAAVSVSGTGDTVAGGLVGEIDGSGAATGSYWDTDTSGQSSSAVGTAKTTSELQTPTGATGIYSGWSTVNWDFGTTSQYPALKEIGVNFRRQRHELPVITLSVVDSAGNAVTSISEAVTTAKSAKIRAVAAEAVPADTQVTLTVAGTAAEGTGNDYTATFPASVTISSGGTTAETAAFDIATLDDSDPEGAETIIVSGQVGDGSKFNVTSATVNLEDNDLPVITVSLSVSSAAESDGSQAVSVSATRSASSTAELTVTVAIQTASTAVRDTDWSGSETVDITFAAGQTTSDSATFDIDPTQDLLVEGSETIVLGATVTGHDVTAATFTITDDDDPPDQVTLSFADVGEEAGANDGADPVTSTVTVELGNSDPAKDQDIELTHDVVVRLTETANGTATTGTDYAALGTLPTITIPAGQNSATASLSINPTGDVIDEGDGETISFTATAACKTTADPCPTDDQITSLTVPAATLTITDDDTASTTIDLSVSFTRNSAAVDSVGEGDAATTVTVTATLADTAEGSITRSVDTVVKLGTALGGTATGGTGNDYTHGYTQRNITIPAGQSSATATTFTLTPIQDTDSEGTETVEVTGSACQTSDAMCPAGKEFTVNAAVISLLDDDQVDYDADNDGLIEIATAAQLSAMRWDADGDGTADSTADETNYAAAFPHPAPDFCDKPGTTGTTETCTGYELSGDIDLGVAPHNSGDGWLPIPSFSSTLDGNGHAITGLTINRSGTANVGLFAQLASGAVVEDLALTGVSVSGNGFVGALAGGSVGTIRRVFASGSVSSQFDVYGGLVGANGRLTSSSAVTFAGTVEQSLSAVDVAASMSLVDAGGLVGLNHALVRDSFATGVVSKTGPGLSAGGLLGQNATGTGADGSGGANRPGAGIANSYSTGAVLNNANDTQAGLVGFLTGGAATASYWDTTTSGHPRSAMGTGLTTAELQSPTAPGANSGDTYHGWDTTVWDFGTSSEYPVLKGFPLTAAEQRVMFGEITLSVDIDEVAEDAENPVTVTVTAALPVGTTRPSATVVTLSLGGTAEAGPGKDYTVPSGTVTVTIAADSGSGTAQIAITPIDDEDRGGDKTITVSGAAPWFSVASVDVTLADDELPNITLSVVGSSSIGEGDASATSIKVRATLDGGALTTSTTVTLSVASASTATGGGTDYTASVPATLTIPANAASGDSASFDITPSNDSLVEGDETIVIAGTATGFSVGSVTVTITDDDFTDFDADNDRLIDVSSAAKLHAMRWDTNGDFTVDNAANADSFATAFPRAAANPCDDPDTTPVETCAGYELTADIDLDVDPHNTGAGWLPIPNWRTTFNGGGHRITGLMINRGGTSNVGLFSQLAAGSTVTNVALIGVNVRGNGRVGGLAGYSRGTISLVYVSGNVTGSDHNVGGLVGSSGDHWMRQGSIHRSASAATARNTATNKRGLGSLAGQSYGVVHNSYATGSVFGATVSQHTGGLIGENQTGRINENRHGRSLLRSYAIGAVRQGSLGSSTGGLVGQHIGSATTFSYWDTQTSGWSSSPAGTGLTTAQMQAPTAPGAEAGDTYHGWSADIWDFGTSRQYPVLKGLPLSVNEQRGITIVLTADVTTIAENVAGARTVTITATRETGPAESDITVALSLSGSAEAGTDNDYTFTPATLPSITILTGAETATAIFTITPIDDAHWEPDEAIEVNGATAGTKVGPAVITLTSEDDPGLRLNSDTTALAENAAATTVALNVALDEARATDTTLTLSFGGTATKDTDYTVTPTTVAVTAGETSASVNLTITPTDNSDRNGDKTIVIGTTLAGYVVTSHTIAFTDDEPIPITLGLSTATAAESDDATAVTVTATLDEGAQAADTTVTVTVGADGSTAERGANKDYTGTTTATITIAANQSSATASISIDPREDTIHEGDETVVIGGTAPSGFGVIPATFTITDNDEMPDRVTLSFTDVGEEAGGNDGSDPVTSTVTATLANSDNTKAQNISLGHDVVVRLTEGTGTATAGTDYADLGTLPTVTISAGSLSGTASLSINPTGDVIDEGTGETIAFTGTAACKTTDDPCETDDVITGLTVTGADLTITDDDAAPDTINLSFSPTSIEEDATGDPNDGGNVAVKVVATLVGTTRTTDTVVTLASALTGTATGGTDYTSSGLPASVTIPAEMASGEATGLKINPTDDSDGEAHETIEITGTACKSTGDPCPDQFTVNKAVLTLADDDGHDYDSDNDQLIEIDSVAKLNAIRWDTNGDFVVDNAANQTSYSAAFPHPAENFCDDPSTTGADEVETCAGYELTADIDLDVAPYNTGDGWVPIREWRTMLDGNGHSISGLFTVARQNISTTGFIFQLNSGATLEDLALIDARVTRLAGSGTAVAVTSNLGTVRRVFVSGNVSAVGNSAGGLVAQNQGTIEQSVSAVTVRNTGGASHFQYGALVGINSRTIRDSFATGSVRGGNLTGGLVGVQQAGATSVTNSYSTAAVTAASGQWIGGLLGRRFGGSVSGSYWDTQTSGQSGSHGGTGRTTAQLQSPTAPGATTSDTYHGWSTDVWDFGTSSQYPVLKTEGFPLTVEEQRAMLGDIVLSVDKESVAEDADNPVTVRVTATLSGSTRPSATVVALSLGGTATRNTDYTATLPASLTIPANQQSASRTFTITPTDNNNSDGNKTIVVGGARDWFGVESVTITLVDDDLPTITLDTGTVTSISEGSSASVTITATLDDGTARSSDVTVDLTLSGATSGTDYTISPTTLGDITITTGDTSGTASVTIAVPEENTNEGSKTLVVGGTAAGFNINTDSITLGDDDSPSTKATLSVNPTSIDEEDGAQAVAITATLDGAVRSTNTSVTVNFGDTGTAKRGAGKDYQVLPAGTGTNTITSGSINITAGQKSGSTSFRFRPVDDDIDEGASETITITGSTTATDLTDGVDSVDLTLDDDDTVGTAIGLTFTSTTAAEGGAALQNRVRAAFASGKARTVDTVIALSYSSSTATSGTDYTAALPTSITIPAGQVSAQSSQFTVTIVDDKIHEGSEAVTVGGTLSGFTFTSGSFSVTDNDDAPDRVKLSFLTVGESAGSTTSTVTATLANADSSKPQDVVLTQDVTVTLSLGTGGTATAGTDYTGLSDPLPTVTISAGSRSGTASISITTVADEVDEGDGETIPFTATATTTQSGVTLTGVGADLTITEDAPLISSIAADTAGALTPNNFIAQAFGTGTTGAELTEVRIRFSGSDTGAVVRIREDNGSNRPDMSDDGLVATLENPVDLSPDGVHSFTVADGDTVALDGAATYWVTIHEGVTANRKRVFIQTNPATTTETGWTVGNRLFRNAEGAVWEPATNRVLFEVRGRVYPAVTAEFSAASYSATEGGTATVTVELSEAPKRPVTLPISAANQGGASSSDYSGVPAGVTFGAGDTSKSFTFTAVDDSLDDDGESVKLTFGTLPSGVTASGTTEATVTITDNDDTPDTINLSFDPATVAEDATGNVAVKVVATLAGSSTRTVATTVRLATTLGGTAQRGTDSDDDYTATGLPTSVTIPAGMSKGEATGLLINPADNNESDGNRTVTLAQGTPALSGFTVNAATMTITDDELPLITLSVVDSSGNEVSSISEAVTTAKSVKIKAVAAEAVAANTQVTLTWGGTATAGGTDYSRTGTVPTTVTISSGGTTAETGTFNIATVDDSVPEGTETVVVSGQVGTGTTFNVKSATVDLIDNDLPVITVSLSPTSATESAGNQAVSVSATRSASSTAALDVTISRQSASTAVRGTDYAGSQSVTVSFAENQTSSTTPAATFNIDPTQDRVAEGSETIVLGATVSGHTVTAATFTITDDDETPNRVTLSFSDVGEEAGGNNGNDPVASTVTATLANSDGTKAQNVVLTHDVVVRLAKGTGGTATSADYSGLPSTLPTVTISAGSLSGTASVAINPTGDNIDEGAGETIPFTGTATCKTTADPCPTADQITGLTVTGANLTITDDDTASTTINLSSTLTRGGNTVTSIGEGDSDATTVSAITATLSGTKTRNVATVVTLGSSLGGTATAGAGSGNDYTHDYGDLSTPLTITIPAGSSSGTFTGTTNSFTVTPIQDTDSEGTETIQITGEACQTTDDPCEDGDEFTVNAEVIDLIDDDLPVIELTLSTSSAGENAAATSVVVTATRKTPDDTAAVTVNVTVGATGSTASRGSSKDYTGTQNASISLRSDQTSNTATISIDPVDDRVDDDGEKIVIAGAVGDGTTHAVKSADFTITDNDDASTGVTLSLNPTSVSESATGATSVTVTATLNKGASTSSSTVSIASLGGTAGSSDYSTTTTFPLTITIAAESRTGSATISIDPAADNIDEGTGETITVAGTHSGSLAVTGADFTINDDDTASTTIDLSFDPASIAEDAAGDPNDGGNVPVKVVATLAGTATRTTDTTVNLAATFGGTAGSSDYASSGLPSSVTIPAGQSKGEATGLKINPTDNNTSDGNKTITLAQHGTNTLDGFTVNSATLTLADDELPLITLSSTRVSPSGSNDSVAEGASATFRITATRDTNRTTNRVSVPLAVQSASTATAGTDYTELSSLPTINIPANQSSASRNVTISTSQDRLVEGGETVVLGASVTGFNTVPATVTITDDDNTSTTINLTVSPTSFDEEAEGDAQGDISVTVTAAVNDGAVAADTAIKLSLSGTATSGTDYEAPSSLSDNTADITISAGQTQASATFKIDPTGDVVDEGTDETIIFGGTEDNTDITTLNTATLKINDNDTASTTVNLSFSPSSIDENAAGDPNDGGNVPVKVVATLAGTATRTTDTTVNLAATFGGTAGSSDYASSGLPSSVTIPATKSSGEATGLKINPTDNNTSDGNKTITLAQHGTNTLADFTVNSATLTLADDELPLITLSLSTTSAGEGATNQRVTVTASRDLNRTTQAVPVTVKVGDTGSTAERGSSKDYAGTQNITITIPANMASRTGIVNIDPRQDRVIESGGETIVIGGSATGYQVTPATFTINDDDVASTGISLSLSHSRLREAAASTSVRVTAEVNNGAPTTDTTVKLVLTGTATSGTDFTAPSSLSDNTVDITISANQVSGSASFNIDPTQDNIDEGTGETIIFGAVGGQSAGLPVPVSTATLTITDDETASVALSVDTDPGAGTSTSLGEDDDSTAVTVTATLSHPRSDDTTVTLSALAGTATEDTDYTVAEATLPSISITAGQTTGTATITIDPEEDRLDEGASETIVVAGSSDRSVSAATITLTDNDAPSTTVRLSSSPPTLTIGEGATAASSATLTATLDDAVRSTATVVTLEFRGMATEGVDYSVTPSSPTITIPANQPDATTTITFSPIDDVVDENSETISVGGSTGVEGLSVSGIASLATLTDDDTASTTINLRMSPVGVNEKDAGRAVTVTVTAELAETPSGPVTRPEDTPVTLTLTGADSDAYTAVLPNPAEVVIPAGETQGTATVRVTTRQDDDATSETITVGGAATGFTVNSAAVTINDDDSPSTSLTLTVNRATLAESSGATQVTVTATLDGGTRGSNTTVTLELSGEATRDTDYTLVEPPLPQITIAAGETRGTATFRIDPEEDTIDEGSGETITVGGTASGGLAVTPADITISDNDRASTRIILTVDDNSIGEQETSPLAVTVTATLEGTVTRSEATVVTLRLGGSATGGGVDYTAPLAPTVTIPAGLSTWTATLQITPQNDSAEEGTETIDIIGDSAGFTVRGATVSLVDDDSTPPAAVDDLSAALSGRSVRLTWSAPTTPPGLPLTGYRLQRWDGGGDWADVPAALDADATSYTDRGLDYSTHYSWRIFAVNADGSGPPSNQVDATTGARPRPPSGPPPPPEDDEADEPIQEIDFEDVSANSVHYRGITTVVSLGIMPAITGSEDEEEGEREGDADGEESRPRFEPGNLVTRSDIAGPLTRLAPLLGRDCPPDTDVPFEDVAADDPDRSGIVCLHALGITVGTSVTTYSPDQHLTRAQAATMLARIWQASGRECPSDADMPFEDVAVDSVHRSSIACLYALGITAGTSATTYSPDDHLTRAQAATFITRLYEAAKLHDPQAVDS